MFCLTCDRLGVPRPVSVQNDFNFNNRTYETSTAEACHHLGVVGMPYGALGGGALTGKYQAVWKSTSVSGALLGDDVAVLARSSGEEPTPPRHRAGVASMASRTTR